MKTLKETRCLWSSLARNAAVTGVLSVLAFSAAAEVVGSFVVHGDGTVTYSYEIDNTGGTFDIALWSLEFPFAPPDWNPLDNLTGGDVIVPNAIWFAQAGTPVGGLSAQDFLSLDPAGDVLAGTSLAGFSFTSRYLPGSISFFEYSAGGDSASGTTVGPAVAPNHAVPDGGGWWADATLAGVALVEVRRRVRRSGTLG